MLFDLLDAEFDFTLDAAASADDHKVRTYFTPDDNALERSWSARALRPTGPGGHVLPRNAGAVFCNPPYSVAGGGLARWVAKALQERELVDVVLVLPTTRTTGWARELLEHADEIRYPLRRVAFVAPPGLEGSAPRHETMIPVLRRGGRGPARELSWDLEAELARLAG